MSGASAQSLEGYERALRALNIYRGDALAIIDETLAAQPDFAMGHILRAQVQVMRAQHGLGAKYAEYQKLKAMSPQHQIVLWAGPALESAYAAQVAQ